MAIDRERWARLRPLLEEALELGPDARATWLGRQRERDPALAQELEAMLAEEHRLEQEGFLADDASAPSLLGSGASLAGKTVGPYTIESLLGQGGMGSVWLARRTDGRFDAKVAVKFMSIALLDPLLEARFRREGSTLARLAHPNIARLIDAGVGLGGQPYLVLEYVDGKPLDRYCDDAKLGAAERIRLFGQVVAAVQHAHANLIVHRDLKPSNILVTGDGTVKLLDFGIAKLLDGESGAATALTQPGINAFTPEYASPEQVRGEPVSVATDVYSLGVLLYQLLGGRHPTSDGCRTPSDFVRAILSTDPPRLSDVITRPGGEQAVVRSATGERLRRLYHGDLDNILARALKKEPGERYPSVAAFGEDLARFLRHEPVSARPDSWTYRAGKFVRRNRGSVASALVVALALIGATVVTWRQMLEARRQRDEAVFQARRADAIRAFQGLLISQIGEKPLTMRELLDKGRGVIERYRGDPRVTATMLGQFAERYGELSDNAAALALLRRADSLAAVSGDAGLRRDLACSRGSALTDAGQDDSARALVSEALAGLRRERDPDRRSLAGCLMVASQLVPDSLPDSSQALLRRSLAELDTAGALLTLQAATVYNQLAIGQERTGAPREALALYQRAADVMDSIGYGETFPAIALISNRYSVLSRLGELQAGLAATREAARRVDLSDPGSTHPVVGFQHAQALFNMAQYDSSVAWYQRVVAAANANGLRDVTRRAWLGMGRAASRKGDLALARRALDSVLAIARELKRPPTRDSLFLAGSIALAEGRWRPAADAYAGVLEVDGYAKGKRNEGMRPVLVDAAQALVALGQGDSALALAAEAGTIAAVDSIAAARSGFVGEAALRAAQALVQLGRKDQARVKLTAAIPALASGFGENDPRTREARALAATLGGP
ncbi:MAG TPA: protein kinase [Gemmatimonadales bacterium]|nr:protein kinase [Gemmatimonadales bacterium]